MACILTDIHYTYWLCLSVLTGIFLQLGDSILGSVFLKDNDVYAKQLREITPRGL